MKLQYESNARGYFQEREEIEAKIILETNWLSYFNEHVILDTPIEDPKTLDNSDLLTFHQIMIQTLKGFIDTNRESESMCAFILAVYERSKTELENRFHNYPQGSGFLDYLSARSEREQRDNARITGSMCPNCGSADIASYGDKWKCRNCKKLFRKH